MKYKDDIYIYDFCDLSSEEDDFKVLRFKHYYVYKHKPIVVDILFDNAFNIEEFMNQFDCEAVTKKMKMWTSYNQIFVMDKINFASLLLIVDRI